MGVNMAGVRLYRADGTEVQPGDQVTDSRGQIWVLRSARGPSGKGSDAKVFVEPFTVGDIVIGSGREFYARVMGLRWEEAD